MMEKLTLRELYQYGIYRIRLSPTAEQLLGRLMAEDDSGKDFEEAIRIDRFFTRKILEEANKLIKMGSLKSISHATVLIGKETIRDFILGHSVRRINDPQADTAEVELNSSKTYLARALQAESIAQKIENPHPGMALGIGFLWDIFDNWIKSDPVLSAAAGPFFQRNWTHSLRTAVLAWTLANDDQLDVPLKKIMFAGGLAHDLGKLILCCAFPKRYLPLVSKLDEVRQSPTREDTGEVWIESAEFGLAHPEVASLLFFNLKHSREIEELVDFHHDFQVLKVRNPNLYLAQCILKMADQLAFILDTKPSLEFTDVQKVLTPYKSAFPFRIMETHTEIAILRSKGYLP